MSEDEFDNLSDPFANVTEAEWSSLLGQTDSNTGGQSVNRSPNGPPPRASPSRSTTSSDYGDDSYMDADALAELDHLEASALQTFRGPSSSTHGAGPLSVWRAFGDLIYISGRSASLSNDRRSPSKLTNYGPVFTLLIKARSKQVEPRPAKRPRSQMSGYSEAKENATEIDETIHRLFESYEEELTCPIYCGDCGWQWVKKSKKQQCPVCRAKLKRSEPLIPNITMDSLIEKHVVQLGIAGDPHWQSQGSKCKERNLRKEKWKASVSARTETKQKSKADIRPIVVDENPQDRVREVLFLPSDDDSSYVEESSEEQGEIDVARVRRLRSMRRPLR
ncbi:hypothetical protein AN958_01154 [Leucoagaricus sp. SymC.cos]|nr:hypothetical protein AN958_01154 [Leucoagaricus sp. SymC.cos]